MVGLHVRGSMSDAHRTDDLPVGKPHFHQFVRSRTRHEDVQPIARKIRIVRARTNRDGLLGKTDGLRPYDGQRARPAAGNADDPIRADERELRSADRFPALFYREVVGTERDQFVGTRIGDDEPLRTAIERHVRTALQAPARDDGRSRSVEIEACDRRHAVARPHDPVVIRDQMMQARRFWKRAAFHRQARGPISALGCRVAQAPLQQPNAKPHVVVLDIDIGFEFFAVGHPVELADDRRHGFQRVHSAKRCRAHSKPLDSGNTRKIPPARYCDLQTISGKQTVGAAAIMARAMYFPQLRKR
jgi:hypothetical protein